MKTWNEEDVTVQTIRQHLEDNGLSGFLGSFTISYILRGELYFFVRIDQDLKIIEIFTDLPIDYSNEQSDVFGLAQKISDSCMLRCVIDDLGHLSISTYLYYKEGLIIEHLMIVINDFLAEIDQIIDEVDEDKLIVV